MVKDLLEKNIEKENIGTVKNVLHQLKKRKQASESKITLFFRC